jgi:hypothetical protein
VSTYCSNRALSYWFIFCVQNYTTVHFLIRIVMNDINNYSQISIHPDRITYYFVPLNRKPKFKIHESFTQDSCIETGSEELSSDNVLSSKPAQFEENYHNGKVSEIAAKKIGNALSYLVFISSPQNIPRRIRGKDLHFCLNFITLTLSSNQTHSDHEIYNHIFRPFLMALNRKWKVSHYVWRAEKQSNGSLHYHLVTNKFIPWHELRDVWNRCQQNLGYVTRYRENQIFFHREGFRFRPELATKWNRNSQLKAYQEGCRTDWQNPNSIDVHSLNLVSNVKSYFMTYFKKQSQSANIKGRLWGCSYSLSGISGAQVAVYDKIDSDLEKLSKSSNVRIYTATHFTVIYVTVKQLKELNCFEILEAFYSYIGSRFLILPDPDIVFFIDHS